MFVTALILGVIASLAAAVLSFQLKKAAPDTHAAADDPSGTEFWPFWALNLLSPKMWRRLPPGLKALAFIATASLVATLVLMAMLLLRFVTGEDSL